MMWMSSEIKVGAYVFKNRTNQVKIKHSRKELTATCEITLPNLKAVLQRNIKAGDIVEVKLGYNDDLHVRFSGYVKEVAPQHPYKIICEDEMWALKQTPIKPQSWASVNLKELCRYIYPDCNYQGPEITLSPFRIERDVKSCAEALQKVHEEFGLDVYFRGKQLYAGLAYQEQLGTINYAVQQNVKKDGFNLSFKRKEDMRIKVVAVSVSSGNSKVEVTVGDNDGETHTLHYWNKTKAELKSLAENQLELMKFDGYRGTFKAMGYPRPLHGMICNIQDNRYPERSGKYFIDSVEIEYGSSTGYQNTIELGRRASA